MVGGKVIGVIVRGDKSLLNILDGRDECAVRCGLNRIDNGKIIRIHPGDGVWWQAGKVYWTPVGSLCRYDDDDEELTGKLVDIALPKFGYSH